MALDLAADVLAMLRTDEFAESIVYLKRGGEDVEGGSDRTINAIIDRGDVQTIEGLGVPSPVTTVIVANHATSGILASEIDIALDKIQLPMRHGAPASVVGIARINTHDAGALTFEVE